MSSNNSKSHSTQTQQKEQQQKDHHKNTITKESQVFRLAYRVQRNTSGAKPCTYIGFPTTAGVDFLKDQVKRHYNSADETPTAASSAVACAKKEAQSKPEGSEEAELLKLISPSGRLTTNTPLFVKGPYAGESGLQRAQLCVARAQARHDMDPSLPNNRCMLIPQHIQPDLFTVPLGSRNVPGAGTFLVFQCLLPWDDCVDTPEALLDRIKDEKCDGLTLLDWSKFHQKKAESNTAAASRTTRTTARTMSSDWNSEILVLLDDAERLVFCKTLAVRYILGVGDWAARNFMAVEERSAAAPGKRVRQCILSRKIYALDEDCTYNADSIVIRDKARVDALKALQSKQWPKLSDWLNDICSRVKDDKFLSANAEFLKKHGLHVALTTARKPSGTFVAFDPKKMSKCLPKSTDATTSKSSSSNATTEEDKKSRVVIGGGRKRPREEDDDNNDPSDEEDKSEEPPLVAPRRSDDSVASSTTTPKERCTIFKLDDKSFVAAASEARDGYRIMRTRSGLPLDIAKSALQKAIRRGNADLALGVMADCLDLECQFPGSRTASASVTNVLNRLAVICVEDIDVANVALCSEVLRFLEEIRVLREHYKKVQKRSAPASAATTTLLKATRKKQQVVVVQDSSSDEEDSIDDDEDAISVDSSSSDDNDKSEQPNSLKRHKSETVATPAVSAAPTARGSSSWISQRPDAVRKLLTLVRDMANSPKSRLPSFAWSAYGNPVFIKHAERLKLSPAPMPEAKRKSIVGSITPKTTSFKPSALTEMLTGLNRTASVDDVVKKDSETKTKKTVVTSADLTHANTMQRLRDGFAIGATLFHGVGDAKNKRTKADSLWRDGPFQVMKQAICPTAASATSNSLKKKRARDDDAETAVAVSGEKKLCAFIDQLASYFRVSCEPRAFYQCALAVACTRDDILQQQLPRLATASNNKSSAPSLPLLRLDDATFKALMTDHRYKIIIDPDSDVVDKHTAKGRSAHKRTRDHFVKHGQVVANAAGFLRAYHEALEPVYQCPNE